MKSRVNTPSSRWWLAMVLLLLAGCGGDDRVAPPTSSAGAGTDRDYFELAMESLFPEDLTRALQSQVVDPRAARIDDPLKNLNNWIVDEPRLRDWEADPLVAEMVPELRESIPALRRLGRRSFDREDGPFLQEASWMSGVAKWISPQTPPKYLTDWMETTQLTKQQRRELGAAWLLFDWTVRNLQLDITLDYPKGTGSVPAGNQQAATAPFGSMRQQPGPGYMLYPLQAMLLGRGDALHRSRIFIQLCRQLNLDAVMLAIDPGGTPRPKPWCVGVLIGEEVFLFDAELGMPIPSTDAMGIATLADVRKTPKLLEQLSIDDKLKYSVDASQLPKLVAMIDASPQYMSLRMKTLEYALPPEHAMVLSVSPSKLRKRLVATDPIFARPGRVRLWTLPFEAIIWNEFWQQVVSQDMNAAREQELVYGVFSQVASLYIARQMHFLGRLENEDDVPGAKTQYLNSRTTDWILEKMSTSRDLQTQMGFKRQGNESPQMFQARIEMHKFFRIRAKHLASCWLALAHYDTGRPEVAIDWFQKRTIDATPDGPLNDGASYNIARCHETMGKYKLASEALRKIDSPQKLGDRLRANWLDEHFAKK